MLLELYLPKNLEAAATLEDLQDGLLQLRLGLGKLEAAWERAFAPITARVVPMLNDAVRSVTEFVNGVGSVIAALFGGVQLQAKKTVTVTGRAVKRAVADFDQLDRLPTGSGGSTTYTVPAQLKAIPQEFQKIAQQIERILAPIKAIDLSAACEAFRSLKTAVEPLTRGLFAALEWAWFNLLTPMASWSLEQALPAFLAALEEAFRTLGGVISSVKPVFTWLWESLLKPLGQWTGQQLLGALAGVKGYLQTLGTLVQSLTPLWQGFTNVLGGIRTAFVNLCQAMGLWDSSSAAMGAGLSLLQRLGQGLVAVFGSVTQSASRLCALLREAFSALGPALKQVMNGVIAAINLAMGSIETAVNAMVTALNSIRFEIPKWVPLVGGRSFDMGLSYVDLPQVPYLAKGAVLPANKPFLAMVGDQKNGTNVEAPLSLIQEALASVLEGSTGAVADTNRLLAQILDAVGAIEVGDDTIGRAARRYENRMAVMGGVL